MGGKISYDEVKYLIDQVIAQSVDLCILQDQLSIDHQGKQLAQRHKEVDILALPSVRFS